MSRRVANVAALLLASGAALTYSLSYDLGTINSPGPAMWPTIGCSVMLLGTAMLLIPGRDSLEEYAPYSARIRFVAYALAIATMWGLGTEYVGIIVSTFSLLLLWIKGISKESWILSISIAVVGALTVYCLFDVLLGVPFPVGPLERLIGL